MSKNEENEEKLESIVLKKQSRGPTAIKVEASIPKRRQDLLKWTGWGYKDSKFVAINGVTEFIGKRYPIGGKKLPAMMDYVERKLYVKNVTNTSLTIPEMPPEDCYPISRFPKEILEEIQALGIETSVEGEDRLIRSQGEGLEGVYKVKNLLVEKLPDAIAFPTCHEDVVEIVKLANDKNFVIIPYGGGTSVAGALECPLREQRPVLSLDMCLMNEILWLDEESLIVCVEAGCVGKDLERELNKKGYTTGHEPDSLEFSTVGGWVSTRASGMKRNKYGNIEDIVVHLRMVTPVGVLEKASKAPRMSVGPDFNHFILGSEGSFGIITEVVMKIRPLPEHFQYGSIIFPDFETGIEYLREVARRKWQPASIRLLDHEQFQLGLSLRPEQGYLEYFIDSLKFTYLEKVKGFDPEKMCMVTLLFEDYKSEIIAHEKKLYKLAANYSGVPAGPTNGQRGYTMTYLVAYIRDIAMEFDVLADSVETAVPWNRAIELVREIRRVIHYECEEMGTATSLALMRIAQTYDSGCCVYVYYVFPMPKDKRVNMIDAGTRVHNAIKKAIIKIGASLSHHHGVGKYRAKWYEESVSTPGLQLFLAAKKTLDPKNIFGCGNFISEIKN